MLKKYVLFVLILGLALAACTDNPALRSRYQAEKMYFEAERNARQAGIQPSPSTGSVSTDIIDSYQATLDFCYAALDSFPATTFAKENGELGAITFQAASRLSQLLIVDRHHDRSVRILNKFLVQAQPTGPARIQTYLNLGRILQSAGRWDSALSVYDYAVENFAPPTDARGEIITTLFDLPAHVLNLCLRGGDTAEALIREVWAEQYYRQLMIDYPDTRLARASLVAMADVFEMTGKWTETIEVLSSLTDSTGEISLTALIRIANLRTTQLNQLKQAVIDYDIVLGRMTGRDTVYRPMVLFNKSKTLMRQEKYDQVREILSGIKKNSSGYFEANPSVQLTIARSFELEGKWERAETEYKYLLTNFPNTEQGLSMYLYLAGQYSQRGRAAEATRLKERAKEQYDQIVKNDATSQMAALALGYKAELYRQEADWPKTVEILTDLFDRFPTSEIGYRSLLSASILLREQLDRPAAADSLLAEMKKRLSAVDETPNF